MISRDMLWLQYLVSAGWVITIGIMLAISYAIALKVFRWVTPFDDWSEIHGGNIALTIINVSIIIGLVIILASTLSFV